MQNTQLSTALTLNALRVVSAGKRDGESDGDFIARVTPIVINAIDAHPVIGGSTGTVDVGLLAQQANDLKAGTVPDYGLHAPDAAAFLTRIDGYDIAHGQAIEVIHQHNVALVKTGAELLIAGAAAAASGGGAAAFAPLIPKVVEFATTAFAA